MSLASPPEANPPCKSTKIVVTISPPTLFTKVLIAVSAIPDQLYLQKY